MNHQMKLVIFVLFLLSVEAVFRKSKKADSVLEGPCATVTTTTPTTTTSSTTSTTSSTPATTTTTSSTPATTTTTSSTPATTTTTSSTPATTSSSSTTTASSGSGTYQVGVYFGNWKIYGRGFNICQIPISQVDRIFYGFWDPSSGECKLNDAWADTDKPGPVDGKCGSANQAWDAPLKGNFFQLKQLRLQKPSLKISPSLGGWTYSPAFHSYVKDPAARAKLISSCVTLLSQYSDVFNAFDVDFEFPCLPDDPSCGLNIVPTDNDRKYYADLMTEFRAALPANIPLSVATSAAQNKIDALDFSRLNLAISSYNIMSYDFTSGSWGDPWTGHQTNAYLNPADPQSNNRTYSVDTAVQYLIKSGATASKINVGVGMYGRGFKVATGTTPAPFVRSLGGLTAGTWEVNSFDYYDIKANYAGTNNANVFWDDVAKAPYIFDSTKGIYITYDDVRAVQAKVGIVKKYGLEGIFAWEISGDSSNFDLTIAMKTG